MLDSRLMVPPNEKYGKFMLNEVLEAGNFGKHDARNRLVRRSLDIIFEGCVWI